MRKKSVVRELSLKMRKPRAANPVKNRQLAETEKSTTPVRSDDEQWQQDMATLRRAAEELASRRPYPQPVERRVNLDTFHRLAASLNDSSAEDRAIAIRKLYHLDPERAATFLNINLQECTVEERQQIGAAFEASGLVEEAIRNLTGESHARSYRAFSLLFLVAKAGAVRPLLRIIESHPNMELRLALIRLLGSSRPADLVFQFQRLLAKNCLPTELSTAAREAITNILQEARSREGGQAVI